jgi:hypothetical protein
MNRIAKSMVAAGAVAAAALVWSGNAHAQGSEETTTTGPNMGLVTAGILTFGLSYGASAVVASTSDNDSDKHLWIPVAGPWIDLADRGGCGAGCDSESRETGYKVLLVADGIFQAVGALQIVGGLLIWPRRETVSRPVTVVADAKPKIHLAPARVGRDAYGLAAMGTF